MMPAPVEFFNNITELLRDEPDRKLQDKYLDLWNRAELLVTEWDAGQWGFDSMNWMKYERDQLARLDPKPTGRRG
jgi:hypothetical protein